MLWNHLYRQRAEHIDVNLLKRLNMVKWRNGRRYKLSVADVTTLKRVCKESKHMTRTGSNPVLTAWVHFWKVEIKLTKMVRSGVTVCLMAPSGGLGSNPNASTNN